MSPIFQNRQAHFQNLENQYQDAFDRWSSGRLAYMIAWGLILYFSYENTTIDALLIYLLMGVAGFAILVDKHQKIRNLRDKNKYLKLINQDEDGRQNLRFTRKETGQIFDEPKHFYSYDTDIFGAYSVYQLLNRTRTYLGGKVLAEWLKNPASTTEILTRQKAANELKDSIDFRQDFEATALIAEGIGQAPTLLLAWSKLPENQKIKHVIYRFTPLFVVLSLGLLGSWFWGILKVGYALLSLVFNGILLGYLFKDIKQATEQTARITPTLAAYAHLIQLLDDQDFEAEFLQKIKQKTTGASEAIRNLNQILTNLNYRQNVYFALFVGLPTLWDVWHFRKLETWKRQHGSKLSEWLGAIAETEALLSLAGFAFANPDYTVPTMNTTDFCLKTTALGHPLIPLEKRVCNDFSLEGLGKTVILTGSNMSGKSTFERTVALNLVLAQAGAVVCANSFEVAECQVFTSMRSQDSLEESTSSFYAELKRLKRLLDLSRESLKPILYFLDEILKGTNSKDRHDGAKALIAQLHQYQASGFITTHDVELGDELDNEDHIANYSFTSEVRDGTLSFDYRLKTGVCHSFNASDLMRSIGIEV